MIEQKYLFAALLVIGIVHFLGGPGMPLFYGANHSAQVWATGGLTALVGLLGLASGMKK